jgi:exodeoxyribonuclease VII small subunit
MGPKNMKDKKKLPEISELSFEVALAELEEIVRQLEQGKSDLEDAIGAYERGAALRKHCETKLKEAKVRVEKIKLGADGVEGLEPTDLG